MTTLNKLTLAKGVEIPEPAAGKMPGMYGEQLKAKELEMLVNYLAGLK
ncbi:MAG: hypothetical protein HY936_03080 [Nitrosomonadales bacterium]|nr:hypothetical protein [Nitrosomonadales bacterium]